jgi:photosystem II stability/assembly factor-like uncharacterized protein
MRSSLSAFLLFFGAPFAVHAADAWPEAPAHRHYGEWRSAIFGGGGYLVNLAVPDPAQPIMYVHSDVGGVYRSDDAGRSWKMLHGSWPAREGIYDCADINADPRDPDTVLAAVGSIWFAPHGLLRSSDGGQTWAEVLSARFYGNGKFRPDGRVLARAPLEPDRIYAGSGGDGFFISEDGGKSWSKRGLELVNIVHVQPDPVQPDTLWVCAQPYQPFNSKVAFLGGFYRSDDAGRTWEKLHEESPTEIVLDREGAQMLGLFEHASVRASDDGGRTWRASGEGLPYDVKLAARNWDNVNRSNALAVGHGSWFTASTKGELFRRDAGASAWTAIPRQGTEFTVEGRPWWGSREQRGYQWFGAALSSLWIDPRDAARIFFTDWYGIYESRDAGANWALRIDGIETTCVHTLVQDPVTPGRIHTGVWDMGYIESTDAGTSFQMGAAGIVTSNLKAITVSRSEPARLYATGDGFSGTTWQANQLWRSRDGGATWAKIPVEAGLPSPQEGARFCSIAAHPSEPLRAYVTASGNIGNGGGGVYLTTDGGDSWSACSAGLPEGAAFFRSDIAHIGSELAVGTDGGLVAISHGRRMIYRRAAADESWSAVTLRFGTARPRSLLADPHRKRRYFLSAEGEGGGVWVSEDDGVAWRRILACDAGRLALDERVPGRVAVGTRDGLKLSLDAGETWSELSEELPMRWYPVPVFSEDRLLVGTIGGGIFWQDISDE